MNIEKEIKSILRELVEQSADRLDLVVKTKELYFEEDEEKTKVVIPQDVRDLLIYSDLDFHVLENQYYIVKEGIPLYEGVTSTFGAKAVIIADIKLAPDFLNLMLIAAMKDDLKLTEVLAENDNVSKLYVQVMNGVLKDWK